MITSNSSEAIWNYTQIIRAHVEELKKKEEKRERNKITSLCMFIRWPTKQLK